MIWTTLEGRLRAFILSRIPDRQAADDLLQEVFVRVHTRIGTLKDNSRITSWIYQITRNLINDHFRTLGKEYQKADGAADTAEDQEAKETMNEAVHDMIRMMDKMPAQSCEALCMTEIEGLSIREYAEKARISYSSAKSRVQRSRQLLRDMLMNCCHYEFDKYGTVINISPKCCCCSPESKHGKK